MHLSRYTYSLLCCLLILASFYYGLFDHLNDAPQSIHLWRQSDCLSMTLNYYQYNYPLWEPHIHNLGFDGTGKTCSEFPLLYYFMAKIWHVTGNYMFVYRGLMLVIFWTGLVYVAKTVKLITSNTFLAIFTAMLLFSAPTLVYYAHNVLSDIPALSLSFIGLYHTIQYLKTERITSLLSLLLFFCLAGLLKLSSQLLAISVLGTILFQYCFYFKPHYPYVIKHLKLCLGLIFIFILQGIWYRYAITYNAKFNAGMFLTGILPIWDLHYFEIKNVIRAIYDHFTWDYFRGITTFCIAIAYIYVLKNRKSITDTFLFYLCVCTLVGLIIYVLLFFEALKDHDYYCINLYIIIPVILMVFFLILKQNQVNLHSKYMLVALCIGLLHNIDFTKRRMEQRYQFTSWHNSAYALTYIKFETLKKQLLTIGISANDKIISISDNSINTSLYFLNRKGWTNYNIQNKAENMTTCIHLGARYLVVLNSTLEKHNAIISSYTKGIIAKTKDFSIYKLT